VQATPATDQFFKEVYEPLTAKAAHTVVKPGRLDCGQGFDLEGRRVRG